MDSRVAAFLATWEADGDDPFESLDEVLPELPYLRTDPAAQRLLAETGRALTERYFQAKKARAHRQTDVKAMNTRLEELTKSNEELAAENAQLRHKLALEVQARRDQLEHSKRNCNQHERANQALRATNEKLLADLRKADAQLKALAEIAKRAQSETLAKTRFFDADNVIAPTLAYFFEGAPRVNAHSFRRILESIAKRHVRSVEPKDSNVQTGLLSELGAPEEPLSRPARFLSGNEWRSGTCSGGFDDVARTRKIVIDSTEFYAAAEVDVLRRLEPLVLRLLEDARPLELAQESILLPLPESGRLTESRALEELVRDLENADSLHESRSKPIHSDGVLVCDRLRWERRADQIQVCENFWFVYPDEPRRKSTLVGHAKFARKVEYHTDTIKEADELEEFLSGSDPNSAALKSQVITRLEQKVAELQVKVTRACSKQRPESKKPIARRCRPRRLSSCRAAPSWSGSVWPKTCSPRTSRRCSSASNALGAGCSSRRPSSRARNCRHSFSKSRPY